MRKEVELSFKNTMRLYKDGEITHNGVKYFFVKETELMIKKLGDTPNNNHCLYSRENLWYIKDEFGTTYKGITDEQGDYIHDLQMVETDYWFYEIS